MKSHCPTPRFAQLLAVLIHSSHRAKEEPEGPLWKPRSGKGTPPPISTAGVRTLRGCHTEKIVVSFQTLLPHMQFQNSALSLFLFACGVEQAFLSWNEENPRNCTQNCACGRTIGIFVKKFHSFHQTGDYHLTRTGKPCKSYYLLLSQCFLDCVLRNTDIVAC